MMIDTEILTYYWGCQSGSLARAWLSLGKSEPAWLGRARVELKIFGRACSTWA